MKKFTSHFFVSCFMLIAGTLNLSAQPSTAAPTPPQRASAKVISIFSDAYTNVAGTDFNPNWGQSTVVTTEQIDGNNTLKYATLNYQGTQLAGSVNALPMNKLHIDVWSADATTLQISPISSGPKEFLYTLTPLNLNSWNSYDIDLSAFTGVDMSDIIQFKIVGDGTVYIDNLYLYDSTTTVDTEAPTAFTAEKGAVTSDGVELLLNATDNSGAINYVISYGNGKVDSTSGVSGVQKSYTVSSLEPSTNYTFTITAKDPTGNVAANSPLTVSATTAAALPAAPTPTVDSSKVISIYSDAYTNVANTDFYPGWGQSTVASEVDLGGNKAMKYTSFNYQGIQLASNVNASGMTKLHVDIYPTTETSIRLTPISPGPQEFPTSLGTLTANQWNSFDIALSTYTGVDMGSVFQFKLDGGTGNTFYMDNLYLYNDASTGVKNISDNQSVKCYLNNTGQLVLKSNSDIQAVVVRNLLGQTLKTVNANASQLTINFADLASGNYLVTMKTANGQVTTRKITKI